MRDFDIEKAVQKAKGKIPSDYCLSLGELLQLNEICKEKGVLDGIIAAYVIGMCRGSRGRQKNTIPVL